MTTAAPTPPAGTSPRGLSRRGLGRFVVGGVLASLVPEAWAGGRLGRYAQGPPPDLTTLAPGSRQALLVTNDGYGRTRASVTGWSLHADQGWQRVLGPFDTAWLGARGFAHPGAKVEGDLRTPTGAYTVTRAFGVDRPAGLRLPWHQVEPGDYWVDDPRAPWYNALVDSRVVGRAGVGRTNPLPRYTAAAGIDINLRRRPYAGSAVFLHPTHDSPTLGCVALPVPQLVAVLAWLRPAAHPKVVLGVGSELVRLAGGPLRPPPPPRPPTPTPPPPTSPPPPVP